MVSRSSVCEVWERDEARVGQSMNEPAAMVSGVLGWVSLRRWRERLRMAGSLARSFWMVREERTELWRVKVVICGASGRVDGWEP